ncbi:TPA: hypothetical protein ACK1B7_004558 [Serratia marcescens]|uniref:hypothetical protein n=1 Tax=Serratia nevei TaxID=2703794 RepID=UPI00390788A6
MFGIDALLKTYPSLLVYIKLLGGAYLILSYLAGHKTVGRKKSGFRRFDWQPRKSQTAHPVCAGSHFCCI